MKSNLILLLVLSVFALSCKEVQTNLKYENPETKIIFLHHSTGKNVWYGDVEQNKRFNFTESMCLVPRLLKEYNDLNEKKISIEERSFPLGKQYAWKNYPYDYYNIWVKNAGDKPYMEEPTLEMLTKEYNIIIFKHCFPVSNILEDDGTPDVNSEKKTLANYKLQYDTLKSKLHEFPNTQFIVWTGAALVEAKTNPGNAQRAVEFSNWVKEQWDEPGDNIEIFDFREIETEGGLYLKPEYAMDAKGDPHPNMLISEKAAKLFVEKIIEIVE